MNPVFQHSEVYSLYPPDKFRVYWWYSNRIVLFEEATQLFHFFREKQNGDIEPLLCNNDLQIGIGKAMDFWAPKDIDNSNFNIKKMALNNIESTLCSILKKAKQRNQEPDITKEDVCCIYYDGSHWHAYYSDSQTLIKHHATKAVQKIDYVNFLNSNDFVALKAQLDAGEMVVQDI